MKDLITVVVPVYNAVKYLRRCAGSILAQTYPLFELLLINDGSLDNSGSICDDIAGSDARVTVVHRQNHGVSMTRNIGIELARGKYIAFCDSDDVLDPDYLKDLHQKAVEMPDYLPLCWLKIITDGSSKEMISKMDNQVVPVKNFALVDNHKLLHSPCNKLYQTAIILEDRLRFNTYFSIGEDILFNLGYIKHVQGFAVVSKPLYTYYLKSDEGLNCSCGFDRLMAVEAMYDKLMGLADRLGSDESMKRFIRKNMLEEYVLAITLYAMENNDGFRTKSKVLKKLLRSPQYTDVLSELDSVSMIAFRKKLMKNHNPWIILLYFRLAKLKRNIIARWKT